MVSQRSPDQTQPLWSPTKISDPSGGPPALVVDGRAVSLRRQRPVVIGSGRGCDLWVDDPFVSRQHVRLHWRPDGAVVEDLGSTNGVLVDGKRVEQATIRSGQGVLLGRHPLIIAERVHRSRFTDAVRWHGMVGRARRTLRTWGEVMAAASTSHPVWLRGESGVGKELIARALHDLSPRKEAPFVAINCAALPATLAEAELFGVVRGAYTGAERSRSGAFSRAHGGTLLLDEVGDLPPDVQGKMLRVLETGVVHPVGAERCQNVDVRIIAASWRDLESDAEEGRFRFDLLQRLAVLKVELSPLRTRRKDIGPLLEAFLAESDASALWPAEDLLRELTNLSWPGNVRQLRSHARRAGTMGNTSLLIPDTVAHAQRSPGQGVRLGQLRPDVALTRVRSAISACGGNRAEAARSLGVSRSTLYRWLTQSDLSGRHPVPFPCG